MKFLMWKWRKYPIKRDEKGHSLRQQAFKLFDHGYRPAQIYKEQLVEASQKTLLRYFEDWKKKGSNRSYNITKKVMKDNPDFTEKIINALSEQLEMPVKEILKRMQKPWGLKQALRGQWPDYGLKGEQSDIEARLNGALWFMRVGELFRNSPEELAELLQQIIMLKENTKLEIIKQDKHLIYKKWIAPPMIR